MKLERRSFLRAAGVTIALPLLEALAPKRARAAMTGGVPRRMICICAPLGFYPPNFFPEQAGRDYEPTIHLELLSDYRNAIPALLPEDAIPLTRKACGEEVARFIGTDPAKSIDVELKSKLVDMFKRLSNLLALP